MQENLSSLEEWCRSNYMSFNVGKCSIVTFSRTEPTDLALYGKPLAHSSLEKDLGLLVSDKLKWKDHITGACSKSNRVLNLIKRNVGHRVSTKHRKDLYKSMVIPILLYGSTAWSPSKGDLRLIERVQRRATYWMLNYCDDNYCDRLKKLNLLPLSLNIQVYDILAFLKLIGAMLTPHSPGMITQEEVKTESTAHELILAAYLNFLSSQKKFNDRISGIVPHASIIFSADISTSMGATSNRVLSNFSGTTITATITN